MSDIIEKTLASLPKLFSDGPRGSPGEKIMPQKKIMGRAFQGFLCSVSRCRSLTVILTYRYQSVRLSVCLYLSSIYSSASFYNLLKVPSRRKHVSLICVYVLGILG